MKMMGYAELSIWIYFGEASKINQGY